jgi:hypothetical protein
MFAALMLISEAWGTVRENIKISAKEVEVIVKSSSMRCDLIMNVQNF